MAVWRQKSCDKRFRKNESILRYRLCPFNNYHLGLAFVINDIYFVLLAKFGKFDIECLLFWSVLFLPFLVIRFDIASLQFHNLDLRTCHTPKILLLIVKLFAPVCIMTTPGFFWISGFKWLHISSAVARG